MAHDGVNGTRAGTTRRATRCATRCATRASHATRARLTSASTRGALVLVVALVVALGGCVSFTHRALTEGLPDARTYLGRPDRAPAQDEVVDTNPSPLWKRKLGRAGTIRLPAVGERVTLLTTPDRWLYALDTRDGKVLWRRHTDAPFAAGPIVAEGLVVSANEGPFGRMTAVRLADGKRKWALTVGDVGAPLTYAGGTVFGVTNAGTAFATRLADGHLLWRREIGPARAAPVAMGARVAFVTITDTLTTLDAATGAVVKQATLPTSTAAAPTPLDDSTLAIADPAGGVLAVSVPDGRVLWRVATNGPVLGPAALARDTLFALTTDCTLWRVPVRAPARADSVGISECVTESAPTVLRDGVLVASVRGEVIYFDPRTRRRVFTRAVRGQLQQPALVLHGQIIVAPALGEVVSFR